MTHRKTKRWTPETDAELRRLYPLHDNTTIGRMLGCSESAVLNRAQKLGLKKPEGWVNVGCFQPGVRVWNAGMKGLHFGGRSAETQFKKGHRGGKALLNYKPIGTERISKDGYLERKIHDGMPLQSRWRAVHLVLWESVNGPLPKGHALAFKDGDKTHIALDNLELITRAALMLRNTYHQLPKEVATLIQLRGALVRKINRATRAQKEPAP